jgi:hypothetical protein
MSEVIVLLNDVLDGMRRVHVMSDATLVGDSCPYRTLRGRRHGRERLDAASASPPWIEIPEGAEVKMYQDEIRLFHLVAEWKVRGDMVAFERRFTCGKECPVCHGKGCSWQRKVALFMLQPGEKISQAVGDTAEAYALRTGQDPEYAWVRSLPKGVEYGAEVTVGGSVIVNLFQADWMPDRAVAVGRGN